MQYLYFCQNSTDHSPDNPWRAPGSAPVVDPCGQAGGKYKQTPVGGDSVFATVSLDGKTFEMGDLGSKVLPPSLAEEVANWTVGSSPRVAWGMRYNHGGGYQYRLCPLDKMPCTEEDFQEMPLDFVRDGHAIVSGRIVITTLMISLRCGTTGHCIHSRAYSSTTRSALLCPRGRHGLATRFHESTMTILGWPLSEDAGAPRDLQARFAGRKVPLSSGVRTRRIAQTSPRPAPR